MKKVIYFFYIVTCHYHINQNHIVIFIDPVKFIKSSNIDENNGNSPIFRVKLKKLEQFSDAHSLLMNLKKEFLKLRFRYEGLDRTRDEIGYSIK